MDGTADTEPPAQDCAIPLRAPKTGKLLAEFPAWCDSESGKA